MITYKIINDRDGKPCAVNRSDGWSIPLTIDNTDYQAYLKWLEEGNTPTPADEVTQ
jgi:hypothetical protein